MRDISERKYAETKLRRSEAYLAEAQKLSHTAVGPVQRIWRLLYLSEEIVPGYWEFPRATFAVLRKRSQAVYAGDLGEILELFGKWTAEKITFGANFPCA